MFSYDNDIAPYSICILEPTYLNLLLPYSFQSIIIIIMFISEVVLSYNKNNVRVCHNDAH